MSSLIPTFPQPELNQGKKFNKNGRKTDYVIQEAP
jgi:hypothetical protein